jgi:putative ABC transport system substrate-binding protein
VKRREFIALVGSALAWPLTARAQQPAMPVIGFLGATSFGKETRALVSLHQGLKEIGYVEGQNVSIEYRWAEGRYDLLPALAGDLVRHQVAVIFAPASTPAALAAKAATQTIPIVFTIGSDPIAAGLVASLANPGGNVTGVSILINLLSAKRLELLRTLLPNAKNIAVLMNPNSANAWPDLKETQAAAQVLGLQLILFNATTEREIDIAFVSLAKERASAVFVLADGFFRNQYEQLIALAARHAIPTSYPWPEFAEFGGLIGYGASNPDAWRQTGVYVGRVLKGEKPTDLPVMQATKLEFVINLKTAKTLGLEIPPTLLALADSVIE